MKGQSGQGRDHVGCAVEQYLLESVRDFATGLRSNGYRPRFLAKDIYTRQQISNAVVVRGNVGHVRQVDLVQVRYALRIRLARRMGR